MRDCQQPSTEALLLLLVLVLLLSSLVLATRTAAVPVFSANVVVTIDCNKSRKNNNVTILNVDDAS